MRIAAVSPEAAALGLAPGLALADARARVPDLDAQDMRPDADRALLEQIADGCDRYTPMVAIDGADALILDITGCTHLHGGEQGLVRHLRAWLEHPPSSEGERGLAARLALAETPDKALALARFGVWQGDVAALPVAALAMGEATATALRRAGLKTIGDLASRPRAPLAARFGSVLTTRLARLLGEEDARITPRRRPPPIILHRRFAEPVAHMDDVLAALEALLAEACAELERRHAGGRRFDAALFRTDGQVRRLAVETGQALREAGPVMRLLRERIETLNDPIDPGFGFDLLRLAVSHLEPLAPKAVALDGEVARDAAVGALIDRLSTRLGRGRVTRFAAFDTHIPEQASFERPALDGDAHWDFPFPASGEPPCRPLHLLDPPQQIEVTAEVPDGPPLRFRWRQSQHKVARSEGPERIAAEWWRRADGKGLTRDYYRVEDMDGRRFWLFRHGLYGAEKAHPDWYIHGLFA